MFAFSFNLRDICNEKPLALCRARRATVKRVQQNDQRLTIYKELIVNR